MRIEGPIGTKAKVKRRVHFFEDHAGNSQSQTHSFGALSSGSGSGSGRSQSQLWFQKILHCIFVFFLKPIKPVPKNPIQFEQEKFDREYLDKRRQKLVEGAPITSRQERVLKSALKNSCFSHDNEALNNYRLITGKDFISFVLCYGSILIKS